MMNYQIAVDGFSSSQGSINFNLNLAPNYTQTFSRTTAAKTPSLVALVTIPFTPMGAVTLLTVVMVWIQSGSAVAPLQSL
jgi:hypothetical protein